MQVIVPPRVYPIFETVLRSSALVVSGRVQRVGTWRGLVLEMVRVFEPYTVRRQNRRVGI